MVPTEEEKQRIQEAQLANPDVPLGSAEQFLLSLASISALTPRLQLWAFKLNYEALEKVKRRNQNLTDFMVLSVTQSISRRVSEILPVCSEAS